MFVLLFKWNLPGSNFEYSFLKTDFAKFWWVFFIFAITWLTTRHVWFFYYRTLWPQKKHRKLGNSWPRQPRTTSDFRFPISDFRLSIFNFQLLTSIFRLPTSDFRLPTSYFTIDSISAARVRAYCKDQSKCTIFEQTNGTRDWLRSHASAIPLYSNWWEYSRTSMCD